MLIMIYLEQSERAIYCTQDEYADIKKAVDYLGIKHTDRVVTDKMYRITWFDYIDEEWRDIWCNEDEYNEQLMMIKDAEVEYNVEVFN